MRWSLDLTAILARRPGRGRRPDLEQAVLDLGDLELEELHEGNSGAVRDSTSCGPRAPRSMRSRKADAVAHAQVLARDLLVARQHGFHATDLDDRVAAPMRLIGRRRGTPCGRGSR